MITMISIFSYQLWAEVFLDCHFSK